MTAAFIPYSYCIVFVYRIVSSAYLNRMVSYDFYTPYIL
jgi:hypothetical protein